MNESVQKLKNGIDIRRTVIELKNAVRQEAYRKALAISLAGDFSVFTELLKNEDPKVRKNAALILGAVGEPQIGRVLMEAYRREETLYVRADYLKALEGYDCAPYVQELKERRQALLKNEAPQEENKHIREELAALDRLLRLTEKPRKHEFTGYEKSMEVILLTNREQRDAALRQLPDVKNLRRLAGGARFVTEDLRRILPIRTYLELLFPIPQLKSLEGSPKEMAKSLLLSGLLPFLAEHHTAGGPFYFRLEVRSPMPKEQKSDLVKNLAAEIERASEGQLVNAPGDYELELRLVANREGRFIPLLRLFTIPDTRFSYRTEALPVSISPVNAALIMELAREYLTEGAKVLDPFCGAGTMLTERAAFLKTGALYGTDILEEAVLKARKNAAAAHVDAYFINRDFFDFTIRERFDEIITDLPQTGRNRGEEELIELYGRFLRKLPQVAKPGAVILAYTAAPAVLRRQISVRPELVLLKEYLINEREQSALLLFRYVEKNEKK